MWGLFHSHFLSIPLGRDSWDSLNFFFFFEWWPSECASGHRGPGSIHQNSIQGKSIHHFSFAKGWCGFPSTESWKTCFWRVSLPSGGILWGNWADPDASFASPWLRSRKQSAFSTVCWQLSPTLGGWCSVRSPTGSALSPGLIYRYMIPHLEIRGRGLPAGPDSPRLTQPPSGGDRLPTCNGTCFLHDSMYAHVLRLISFYTCNK